MTNIILFNPALTFTACCVGIVVMLIGVRRKRFWITMAAAVILLPLWPVLIVRCLAVWTVDLCDWITSRRPFIPLVNAAHYLTSKL